MPKCWPGRGFAGLARVEGKGEQESSSGWPLGGNSRLGRKCIPYLSLCPVYKGVQHPLPSPGLWGRAIQLPTQDAHPSFVPDSRICIQNNDFSFRVWRENRWVRGHPRVCRPSPGQNEYGHGCPDSRPLLGFKWLTNPPVLVTGVSPKGIGSATVLNLASQSPGLLILASRTRARVQEVANQVAEKYPGTRVEIVTLDLGSQKAIRQAAADVAALTDKLDILINNAGIVVTSRQATPEGIEQQFGTNHIGPFLFTNLLLPLLRKAAETNAPGATRIVSLSSAGHRLSPIRFSDYNFEGKEVPPEEDHFKPLPGAFGNCAPDGYNGILAYAQSKTANILFTLYLQKYLPRLGITAYSIHPGSKSGLIPSLGYAAC